MIARPANWPTLLAEYLEARRLMPFAWGTNDCCSFAADWVAIATGRTGLLDPWAGYSTAAEALRHLEAAGGVVAMWSGLMPAAPIAPMLARRGDLVVVEIEGRQSIAVCAGETCAGPAANGLAWASLKEGVCAWRV
jgi:hypothetical protein